VGFEFKVIDKKGVREIGLLLQQLCRVNQGSKYHRLDVATVMETDNNIINHLSTLRRENLSSHRRL